tara:strand:- start:124 stop:285 length:162 start_codon:yes stop_codon:yes gene_type:complete
VTSIYFASDECKGVISGVYVMSQKKFNELKDSAELLTLISIFILSVVAIAPVV